MTNYTIADMLTRIRNANLAGHQIVKVPSTKITKAIVKVLFEEELIESFKKLNSGLKEFILIYLKYDMINKKPLIRKIKSVSKPGLRVYSSGKNIPRVLGGFGTAIISTSRGLMTDKQARKKRIGGEILCYIW